jgi:hypothetical protein
MAENQKQKTVIKPVKTGEPIFADYGVSIEFTRELCGTIPTSEESQMAFLRSLKIPPDEADQAKENMLAEAPSEDIPVDESSLSFKEDEDGLFIEGRQFKAAIKEAAVLFDYTKANQPGRQYFQNGITILEEKLHLGKKKTDGEITQYGVVQTQQGQRAIITRRQYVNRGVRMTFTVRCLHGKNFLSSDKLCNILEQMQEAGMGSGRPQGFGKFKVLKIVELDVPAKLTISKQSAKKGKVA